jgi:N-acetylneuraminate lyase
VAERMETAAAWAQTGMQVCVHVGTQCLLDTQRLARHAQDIGADAIAVMCPMTIAKPLAIANVVEYLEAVYRAAPDIPMLVYHFPTLTGTPFRLYDILSAALERVPSVRGAKFTSWDLADFAACQSIGGPVTDLLYSIEGNIVGAAFLGARAFVGMQFSLIAPTYRRIVDAARRGDAQLAQTVNRRAVDFMLALGKAVGPSVEKAVAACKYIVGRRLGRHVGETRPPGARLTSEEESQVVRLVMPFVHGGDRRQGGHFDAAAARFAATSVNDDDDDDADFVAHAARGADGRGARASGRRGGGRASQGRYRLV